MITLTKTTSKPKVSSPSKTNLEYGGRTRVSSAPSLTTKVTNKVTKNWKNWFKLISRYEILIIHYCKEIEDRWIEVLKLLVRSWAPDWTTLWTSKTQCWSKFTFKRSNFQVQKHPHVWLRIRVNEWNKVLLHLLILVVLNREIHIWITSRWGQARTPRIDKLN